MRRALALLLALSGVACARRDPCAFVQREYDALPLLRPVPKDGTHRLRVLYLEDARAARLTREGRETLYRRVEALTKRWLGYAVRLEEVGARDLRVEFAGDRPAFVSEEQRACLAAASLDVQDPRSLPELERLVGAEYAARGAEVFGRLFPETRGLTPAEAARTAAAKVRSLNAWLTGLRTDAGPLVADDADRRLVSTLHWFLYARTRTDADFLLTNTAFLEADATMPIYVMARGGLTTGFVDNNPRAPYGAVGAVSLLPFLGGEELFTPGARPSSPAEKLEAAATMWLHEMGHFLNRYGELYGEAGCIHVAAEGLGYFAWHRAIRKADNRCSRAPATVPKF